MEVLHLCSQQDLLNGVLWSWEWKAAKGSRCALPLGISLFSTSRLHNHRRRTADPDRCSVCCLWEFTGAVTLLPEPAGPHSSPGVSQPPPTQVPASSTLLFLCLLFPLLPSLPIPQRPGPPTQHPPSSQFPAAFRNGAPPAGVPTVFHSAAQRERADLQSASTKTAAALAGTIASCRTGEYTPASRAAADIPACVHCPSARCSARSSCAAHHTDALHPSSAGPPPEAKAQPLSAATTAAATSPTTSTSSSPSACTPALAFIPAPGFQSA